MLKIILELWDFIIVTTWVNSFLYAKVDAYLINGMEDLNNYLVCTRKQRCRRATIM